MKTRPSATWWHYGLRQVLYALLLGALVMGASSIHWFGASTSKAYAVFFLTEEMDVRHLVPRFRNWATQWEVDGWWPPWGGWTKEREEHL